MKAYVTLQSTDDFLYGTLTLHQSLQEVNSQYPLIVVTNPGLSEKTKKKLEAKNIKCYEFPFLAYDQDVVDHMTSIRWNTWLANTASKLNIFQLTEYEKLVYLDSDMLVMRNVDWLFERTHGSAVVDLGPIYDTFADQIFLQDNPREYYFGFNSGLLVLEPSMAEYDRAIALLRTIKGYDQEIIRALWSDWQRDPSKQLPVETSVMVPFINLYLFGNFANFTEIYILHYIGEKPFTKTKIDLNTIWGLCEKIYTETTARAIEQFKGKNAFHNKIYIVPNTGTSYSYFKKLIGRYLKSSFPKGSTAQDLGCGQGNYARLLNEHFVIDGVDVYSPHDNELTRFLYNKVTIIDIRKYQYPHYNLVIMGDILEHLSVKDAQMTIAYAKDHCDMLVIAIPYQLEQEANDNPTELHIQPDLTNEIFNERYPGFTLFCNNEFYGYYIWKKS